MAVLYGELAFAGLVSALVFSLGICADMSKKVLAIMATSIFIGVNIFVILIVLAVLAL